MKEVEVRLPVLHPGQEKLDRVVERNRFTVVMCGRRFGKTTHLGRRAARKAIEGKLCGVFAPNYKYSGPTWRWLTQRLRPAAKNVSEQDKRIELHGGGLIEVWTMDSPDAGRSREYDEIYVDEAGLVRDLELAWNESLRPTLAKSRGRAVFYGTPKGMSHDFVSLFNRAQAGRPGWGWFPAKTSDNPFIPVEELAEAKADMPPEIYAQEYEGVPAPDGGNPFGFDKISRCFVDGGSWPVSRTMVMGWDVARAVDFTVGCGLDVAMRVRQLERWQQVPWGETERRIHGFTARRVGTAELPSREPIPSWMDSTGVGDPVVEAVQRMGAPVVPYVFSAPSKQKLMTRLAGAIQRGQIQVPFLIDGRDTRWLRGELESFGYEYRGGGVRYAAPHGFHDDGVMALALAVYGFDQVAPAEQIAGRVRGDDDHPGFDMKAGRRIRWVPEPVGRVAQFNYGGQKLIRGDV